MNGPVSMQRKPGAESMVIATPIWREQPTAEELLFLRRTDRNNEEVNRWFCAPSSLDTSFYSREFPDWRVLRFHDQVFSSVSSYSMWLTGPDFYLSVASFEFVTICQLDAVLIKDITNVDPSDIDYLGAPWEPPITVLTPGNRIYVASQHDHDPGMWVTRKFGRRLYVGNGGLSLRRVESHIKATEWLVCHVPRRYRENTLEDVLLCAFAPRTGLRIAPASTASQVFLETGAADLQEIPDVYGFHGLRRWNPSLAHRLDHQGT